MILLIFRNNRSLSVEERRIDLDVEEARSSVRLSIEQGRCDPDYVRFFIVPSSETPSALTDGFLTTNIISFFVDFFCFVMYSCV